MLKVDAPTFALHWLIAAAAGISLASGLRIAADHLDHWRAAPWYRLVSVILPQGPVFDWHVASGIALAVAVAAYLVYALTHRIGARWQLREAPPGRRWNVALHWNGAGLLLALCVSGAINLAELPGVPAAAGVLTSHRYLGLALAAYVVLHVASHVATGGVAAVVRMLRPQTTATRTSVLVVVVTVMLGSAGWSADRWAVRELAVPRVEVEGFALDGAAGEDWWAAATPLRVQTRHGTFAAGVTTVTVRAAHDAHNLFVLVSWPDNTPSLNHLPLVRGGSGWRVLHEGFEVADERRWYEDKLAVALAPGDAAAIRRAIHLGPAPLGLAAAPLHRRGLHATRAGSLIDIWHWKAVRTDIMNLAEDQYFGPPQPLYACDVRYVGGHLSDPAIAGGYSWNWQYFYPGTVTPKRLPVNQRHLGHFDTAWPEILPSSFGSMRLVESQPYTAARDTLPVDTTIPSYIRLGDFEGDIAQVGAKGRWRDGVWTVELVRRLDTGSDFDIRLGTGTLMWFALFDHAQVRHSYHLRPLRLVFGE